MSAILPQAFLADLFRALAVLTLSSMSMFLASSGIGGSMNRKRFGSSGERGAVGFSKQSHCGGISLVYLHHFLTRYYSRVKKYASSQTEHTFKRPWSLF